MTESDGEHRVVVVDTRDVDCSDDAGHLVVKDLHFGKEGVVVAIIANAVLVDDKLIQVSVRTGTQLDVLGCRNPCSCWV